MTETKTDYVANCHCQAIQVQFSVNLPIEERNLILCNSIRTLRAIAILLTRIGSICNKNGYVNVYASIQDVTITGSNVLVVNRSPSYV